MWTNIKYILLTALRDWLFAALFVGVVFSTLVSGVMGGTALLEPEQMTLSFSASSARVILVIGMIVFVCFHLRQAFDTKEIDVLLSRPISRSNLVLSYWLGFAFVGALLVIPTAVILLWSGIISEYGFIAWIVSLLLEIWLVISIAMFAALTLKSAVSSVLASLGIYVLSRMMGFFAATAENGILFHNQTLNESIRWVLDIISIIVPRLDFFAKSQWLIYGVKSYSDIYLYVAQAGIFVPLLLTAAIIDFRRKQF